MGSPRTSLTIAPPGGSADARVTPAARNATPVVVKAFSNIDKDHVQNFLDCLKSRKLPNGDVLVGHRSAQAAVH